MGFLAKNKIMHVLVYLRVSTDQQARNENSIPAQREACLKFAEHSEYTLDENSDFYVDAGESGRTGKRNAFKVMTERLKSDPSVKAVLVYDISRIFRNGKEYFIYKDELKKHGKTVISVTEPFGSGETPADFIQEWMLAGFAEFRSRQDGVKIKNGMRHKAERGLYPGLAPFGYCNKREYMTGAKDRRWMETNPIESTWVKEIFSKYSTGRYSLGGLAHELNERGIPARNRRPFQVSSLERILKNPIYIGHVDWGGVENPNGQHEKLVDEETFYKIQTILKVRNYGANKKRKHLFLLRGISWCGECNSRITGAYHTNRFGKKYGHYGCQKMQHTKRVACGQSVLSVSDGENQLKDLIKIIQISESVANRLKEKIRLVISKDSNSNEELKKSILSQIENIENRKKSLLEKYVDENIDSDAYKKFKDELGLKESQLKAELARVEGKISKTVGQIETAIGLVRDCYKTYKESSYENQTLLAQTFFEKVIIKDKKIISAYLKHPFVYICKNKASANGVFQYQYSCGDGGSRTHIRKFT